MPVLALVVAVAAGVAMVGTSDAASPSTSGGQANAAKAAAAPAVTGRRVGWPCTGCITYIPANYDASKPTPIVVALHGDEGDPAYIESVWEAAAKSSAIVFAPLCPTALGCRFRDGVGYTNSWWAWLQYSSQYDDNWIGRQMNIIGRSYKLNPLREYVTGWSGGADYMGWYALNHGGRFAAAGYVVGGVPYHPSCARKKQAAYFLMGSNDFRYLSGQPGQVRNVYTSCGGATTQVVVPGADHQGTVDALTNQGYASKMMTWFLEHPQRAYR